MDLVFEVKGRGKSEKLKKGDIVTEYKVKLVSTDDSAVLTLTGTDPNLIVAYPMSGDVHVKLGKCDQTTLPGAADDKGEE